jgi:hypothetical protein
MASPSDQCRLAAIEKHQKADDLIDIREAATFDASVGLPVTP